LGAMFDFMAAQMFPFSGAPLPAAPAVTDYWVESLT